MGAQSFNFAPQFPQNGFSAANFAFLDENHNIYGGNCSLPGMTPRTGYQPSPRVACQHVGLANLMVAVQILTEGSDPSQLSVCPFRIQCYLGYSSVPAKRQISFGASAAARCTSMADYIQW